MKKLLPFILIQLLLIPQLFAQITIKGKVTDKKGEVLPSTNVFIKGSYDGASSDLEGILLSKLTNKTLL